MKANYEQHDAAPQPEKAGAKDGQEFTPAIAFAMGTINGTVENLRTDLKEWKEDLKGTLANDRAVASSKMSDMEIRIRKLEQWKWMIAGAAAAGGATVGKLFDIIGKVT